MNATIGDDDYRHRLRMRFGAVAASYQRGRAGYAPAAIDWVLAGRRQVLDLGAGTGKLTESLIERGADVVALDPSVEMLDVLRANLPGVKVHVASAEQTGLADEAVDAVVIGSALHWFDRPSADYEIARVLSPSGVVGVFHNRRDTSVPWVAALDDLVGGRTSMRQVRRHEHELQLPLDLTRFGPAERAEFPIAQRVTADQLVDLFASRSYVIDLNEKRRAELLSQIAAFAESHPDLAGRNEFELPYYTMVMRQERLRS